jgi:uncharacterized protein
MEVLRVVITGAVGVGKTTFIRTISEIDVINTDRLATDETALLKPTTTVAFDFGRLTFAPNQALHLYGTPGQVRFDFMWDILIQKAHAYILLVDAHRPQDFRNGRQILSFINQRVQIPMLIGLTHIDCLGAWHLDDVALALGLFDEATRPALMTINPTEPSSVSQALLSIIQQLIKTPVLDQTI